MNKIIGIGEMSISKDERDTIKTFALASCIAVVAYLPNKKAGGMLHLMLPEPSNRDACSINPLNYASTGIPIFIDKFCSINKCLRSEIKISIYGGANSIKDKDYFNVGKRNIAAAMSTLKNMGFNIICIDIGGNLSRTVELNIENGETKVSYQPIGI